MSEIDDPDLTAAEYVLGTLDGDERASVAARRLAEPELDRSIEWWQNHLEALSEAVPEVNPPFHIFNSIMENLKLSPPTNGNQAGRILLLSRSVRRWKTAALVSGAIAAASLTWVALPVPHGPSTELLAVLQKDAGTQVVVLDLDLTSRKLTVRPVGATSPAGTSFELWIIDKSLGAPRSLGTVSTDRRTQASLAGYAPDVITEATYAITIEPAGGSPTGKPSGTPVLVGRIATSPM